MGTAMKTRTRGLWGKFSEAATAMKFIARHSARRSIETSRVSAAIAVAIERGQRFYLPEANHVLDFKGTSNELAFEANLPFDCIAVLSETTFTGGRTPEAGWKISIAFELYGAFNSSLRIISPSAVGANAAPESRSYAVLSISTVARDMRQLSGPSWVPCPGYAILERRRDGPPLIRSFPFDFPDVRTATAIAALDLGREFKGDCESVANLCVMLNLHNVQRTAVRVPEAMAKRRDERGKVPLRSYHVLQVDGIAWDRPDGPVGSAASGVRSHLRRGHIRRLAGGARNVWVRATMVHGSRPGFVDKDYDLTKLSRPAQ